MAIPFMAASAQVGHEVHLATDPGNVEWCQRLLNWARVRPIDINPAADHRASVPGFDAYVNFNSIEQVDYWTEGLGIPVPVQQAVYATIALQRGLPLPALLSPGDHVELGPIDRGDDVLIFTHAAGNPSRSLAPAVVEQIREVYPRGLVDPTFNDKWSLVRAIAGARLVISSDTGPYHLAETVRTPWRCLFTTMTASVRCRFYRHGAWLQSSRPCSPCYMHCGCDDIRCTSEFAGLPQWLRDQDAAAQANRQAPAGEGGAL